MNYRNIHSWLVALSLILASCSPSHKEQTSPKKIKDSTPALTEPVNFDWDKIKKRGTLRVIIENSSTSYFLHKGQPVGYEYDLIHMLAEDLELETELIVENDLSKAFLMLNNGEGDLLAQNLTVTKERQDFIAFSHYHTIVTQVLVQRKPENWRNLKRHEIEKSLIRNVIDLIGKEIVVRKNSSFTTRLENLSDEIGGEIIVVEDYGDVHTEELIRKVAMGEIDYTVADENVALVNARYYSNIDVNTPISLSQQIAWGVRKNAPKLLEKINNWIDSHKNTLEFNYTYQKYYDPKYSRSIRQPDIEEVFTNSSISPYDQLIQKEVKKIGWDWRLVTSLIFQESRFDPDVKSWAGAIGLMQVLPLNKKEYDENRLFDPEINIKLGIEHLKWLQDYWSPTITDSVELINFVLASYNVGQGHVEDARRLAEKFDKNPNVWNNNVDEMLLLKSNPKYYLDPSVQYGYCRGQETIKYVREIINRYKKYTSLVPL